jgi:DNA-binding MarR family transcriptional regulator
MDAPQEPRWLDAEERQAWLALASALNRLPAALDAQLRRDAGISHFEYQVLALLSEAPGRTLRMSELATLAEGSLPRLSQVVARLEQHGWVRRTPDPADGRYTLATLTDQGQAKVTEAAPGHVQEVRRLVFDPLTKTQSRQLREIGRRIMRAIDPDNPTRRGRLDRRGHGVAGRVSTASDIRPAQAMTSMPRASEGCGASARLETATTSSSRDRVSAARAGSLGKERICFRLIETATKSKPVRAAAAPTSATKKFCHWAVAYAFTTAALCRWWGSRRPG